MLCTAAAKSLQSCPTLCDPMDCSLPDSSIHGIFQATVLEWGTIAFSCGWSLSTLNLNVVMLGCKASHLVFSLRSCELKQVIANQGHDFKTIHESSLLNKVWVLKHKPSHSPKRSVISALVRFTQ